MNACSYDIKDIIEADSSLGLEYATDLFIGQEPTEPDNCVTIFDTVGRAPSLTVTYLEDEFYEYPSVQIRVRNNSYLTGWTLINDIMMSLHGRANETVNDTLYTVIACSTSPALLDWDNNGRARFIVNFNIQRR